MLRAFIHTADGTFEAGFSERGLARMRFPSAEAPASLCEPLQPRVERWRILTEEALRSALQGRSPGILPPIDLSSGSPFQQSVWQALTAIPPGKTRTYGELAALLDRPGAARAVGQACGANPIPVLIPCHRVLASQGRLGGFSGGLEWKRRLLQRERTL